MTTGTGPHGLAQILTSPWTPPVKLADGDVNLVYGIRNFTVYFSQVASITLCRT